MWINDLKARFQRSNERKVEELQPLEPVVAAEPEPEPVQIKALSDPSEVVVPKDWQGMGLEQAIYEATIHGDLALREFNKVVETEQSTFTCICGLVFMFKDPFDEHRMYAHNATSHETEINKFNVERRETLQRYGSRKY